MGGEQPDQAAVIDLKVEGAEKLAALAKRLKAAEPAMRKEFYRAISKAVHPMRDAVRSTAASELPRRGGLAKRVAKSKIATKRRMSGANVGVRLSATSDYDIRSINRGRVRRLVYGHKPWVNQRVKPGFWSRPIAEHAPEARRQIIRAVDDTARKIEG